MTKLGCWLMKTKDLKSYLEIGNQAVIGSMKCKSCNKANSQKVENLKCLINWLQGMTKEFMDEKKINKKIYSLAAKCSHEIMCTSI